jgi:hypothetical protein
MFLLDEHLSPKLRTGLRQIDPQIDVIRDGVTDDHR